MKKLSLVLTSLMLVGVVGAAQAKPVTLWEDGAGDASIQGQVPGSPAGWDLTSGTIEKKGTDLLFTVTHAEMPPIGSGPEATRFLWNFTVDGEPYRLTVKSVDIGKPDVVGGQTSDRLGRADVAGHFRLEGECVTNADLPLQRVNCPPLAYLAGTFDAATMSFTIVVPLAEIKAKTGSLIGPGGSNICIICWVTHLAERSVDATIIDSAAQLVTYKVPKK
jgi:hypothetical protein